MCMTALFGLRIHTAGYCSPNSNPAVSDISLHEIIDSFWNEFKAFQNHTNPYHDPIRWASYVMTRGNSYLWHEKYSILYTTVLGYVACCVTSKLCGIGLAERSWGRVKQVKDGKVSSCTLVVSRPRSKVFCLILLRLCKLRSNVTKWKR